MLATVSGSVAYSLQASLQTLLKAVEDNEAGIQFTLGQLVVHYRAILLKLSNICGSKKHLAAVQSIDVRVQVLGRQGVVVLQLGVVPLLKLFEHLYNGFPLAIAVFDQSPAW